VEAGLGKLVKFDQWPKPAKTGPAQSGDAQILMFTGVRYERGTPPPPSKRLNATRKKQTRG